MSKEGELKLISKGKFGMRPSNFWEHMKKQELTPFSGRGWILPTFPLTRGRHGIPNNCENPSFLPARLEGERTKESNSSACSIFRSTLEFLTTFVISCGVASRKESPECINSFRT